MKTIVLLLLLFIIGCKKEEIKSKDTIVSVPVEDTSMFDIHSYKGDLGSLAIGGYELCNSTRSSNIIGTIVKIYKSDISNNYKPYVYYSINITLSTYQSIYLPITDNTSRYYCICTYTSKSSGCVNTIYTYTTLCTINKNSTYSISVIYK